nr:DUF806 family protein [Ligilactobacillus pobuzihii]
MVNKIEQITELSAEHIHTFFIPQNDNPKQDPILIISELSDQDAGYGNGMKFQSEKAVQLQFYYPPDYTGDMQDIESSVERTLLNENIRCYDNAGHVLTPDSQNIINTLKFNYIEEEL